MLCTEHHGPPSCIVEGRVPSAQALLFISWLCAPSRGLDCRSCFWHRCRPLEGGVGARACIQRPARRAPLANPPPSSLPQALDLCLRASLRSRRTPLSQGIDDAGPRTCHRGRVQVSLVPNAWPAGRVLRRALLASWHCGFVRKPVVSRSRVFPCRDSDGMAGARFQWIVVVGTCIEIACSSASLGACTCWAQLG